MERQRDEGHETVGFVLQGAQFHQVIGAVFVVLDVAVEHGAIRPQAQLVRLARGFQPFVAVDLVVADNAADALTEDLGAPAGHGIHTGIAQPLQSLADGDFRAPCQVGDLDHRERLEMHLRKALLEPAQHLAKPIQSQLRMQSANDVKFRHRLAPAT